MKLNSLLTVTHLGAVLLGAIPVTTIVMLDGGLFAVGVSLAVTGLLVTALTCWLTQKIKRSLSSLERAVVAGDAMPGV